MLFRLPVCATVKREVMDEKASQRSQYALLYGDSVRTRTVQHGTSAKAELRLNRATRYVAPFHLSRTTLDPAPSKRTNQAVNQSQTKRDDATMVDADREYEQYEHADYIRRDC